MISIFSFFLILIHINGSSHFGDFTRLPTDVMYHSAFSIQQHGIIRTLSKQTKNKFDENYEYEIKSVQRIKEWFQNGTVHEHIEEMSKISTSMQLHHYWRFELPSILNEFNQYIERGQCPVQSITIANAIGVHPLSFKDSNTSILDLSLPSPLALIVLSSRALIDHFIPKFRKTNVDDANSTQTVEWIELGSDFSINEFEVYSDYPWIDTKKEHFEMMVLVSYLFEFSWDSYCNLSGSQSLLQGLINDYGLVVWNRNTLKTLRHDYLHSFPEMNLMPFYFEHKRLVELCESISVSVDVRSFLTYWLIRLHNDSPPIRPIDLGDGIRIDDIILGLVITSFKMKKMNEVEALISLYHSIFCKMADGVLDGSLILMMTQATRAMDAALRDICMFELWRLTGDFSDEYYQNINSITGRVAYFIIAGGIRKSKFFWFEEKNAEKAMNVIQELTKSQRFAQMMPVVLQSEPMLKLDYNETKYVETAVKAVFTHTK